MAIKKLLQGNWYYSHTETENGNPIQPTNTEQIAALEFLKGRDVLVQLPTFGNNSKSNTVAGTYNIAQTPTGMVLAIMYVSSDQKGIILIDAPMNEPPTTFLKLNIGYETLVFSREEK